MDLASPTPESTSRPAGSAETSIQSTTPPTRSQWAGRHWPSIALFALSTFLVLGTDLVTKKLAFERVAGYPIVLSNSAAENIEKIDQHQPIVLIPYVLNLELTVNPGAVFGQGKGLQWLFITISIFATALILRYFYRSQPGAWITHLALALILAGALGNLYDRLRFNVVRDLLRLFPETQLWPWIFNVADSALVVGTTLILLTIWYGDKHRPTT